MWQTSKPKPFKSTADTRRPRFSFFLTNNVKKQTEQIPSPKTQHSCQTLAQASHQQSGKNLVLNVRKVSFKTRHLNERLSRQKQPRRPVRCRRYRRQLSGCQRAFESFVLFLPSRCNSKIKTALPYQARLLTANFPEISALFCRSNAEIGESMVNEW